MDNSPGSLEKDVFDPKAFLTRIGDGQSIKEYIDKEAVYAQGDLADAIFYIQAGKVKVSVLSDHEN